MQVIDRASCGRIGAGFNARKADANFPGVLVEVDHFSLEPVDGKTKNRWSDMARAAALAVRRAKAARRSAISTGSALSGGGDVSRGGAEIAELRKISVSAAVS